MTPKFFCISEINNSLSDRSISLKKICCVEDFRANILKNPSWQEADQLAVYRRWRG